MRCLMLPVADYMQASLSLPIFDRLIEILIEKVEMGKVKHPWKKKKEKNPWKKNERP